MTPPASQPKSNDGARRVMQVFGDDPWVRFDYWAGRAWEASQNAVALADNEGDVSPKVIAALNAANLAKDFADMVNPVDAVFGTSDGNGDDLTSLSDAQLTLILDADDLD